MNEEKTLIFDIGKFALHDGPGIRTVVFMKGCPLHCLWCHNPESQSFSAEVLFNAEKCSRCGSCVPVCPQKCHTAEVNRRLFDRSKCRSCGRCADFCPEEALQLSGKEMSVSEVMAAVMKDESFYRTSGGGITLSGGEPLAHFDFTSALLKAAKKASLHTAVETCGFAPWEKIRTLLCVTDLWLWDVKAAPEKHEELTGVPWEPIGENLQKAAAAKAEIILRCPLVPGINDEDEHLRRIARMADELKVLRIDLEPYHPLGEGKSRSLGKEKIFHAGFASDPAKKHWQEILSANGSTPVRIY